jgi:hypothetical protein
MTPVDTITRHELFYPAKRYQGRFDRKFRMHPGLRILTPFGVQSELHANLNGPPKPTKPQMYGLMRELNRTDSEFKSMPLWGLYKAIEYFAHEDPAIETHLVSQLGYLSLQLGDTLRSREAELIDVTEAA